MSVLSKQSLLAACTCHLEELLKIHCVTVAHFFWKVPVDVLAEVVFKNEEFELIIADLCLATELGQHEPEESPHLVLVQSIHLVHPPATTVPRTKIVADYVRPVFIVHDESSVSNMMRQEDGCASMEAETAEQRNLGAFQSFLLCQLSQFRVDADLEIKVHE